MKIPIYLLFLLLFPSYVLAVGMSGNSLDVRTIFVPNTQFRFDYYGICNKQYAGLDYNLEIGGDLAKYAVMDQLSWDDQPTGRWIPIGGYLNFPDSIEPPGTHYLEVCFLESCPVEGMVCGRTGTCTSVTVSVPHQGPYPELSLRVSDTNEKQPILFEATVTNFGNQIIAACSGFVDIIDINRNNVGRADFLPSGNISSFGSAVLKAVLDPNNLPSGNYSAKAVITCDGIERTANASFRVGTLNVNIIGHTKELETGGIKRFVTTVESVWNDPLDIRADIDIRDNKTSVKAKTATVRLEPWKILDLEAFVDTSTLEVKEYNVKIDAFYAEKKSTVEGKVNIVSPKAEEAAVEKETAGISTTMLTVILVIIVVILTVVNIFLAVYRKKKEK
ncbi:hypothetical protein HZB90_00405 [archaeon]|nr:hypothetical protein [archaeon]